LAVITVDAPYSGKASRLGRKVFERYFNIQPVPDEPVYKRVTQKKKVQTIRRKGSPAVKKKAVVAKKPSKKDVAVASSTKKSKKHVSKR
jgi:hypothetical protein